MLYIYAYYVQIVCECVRVRKNIRAYSVGVRFNIRDTLLSYWDKFNCVKENAEKRYGNDSDISMKSEYRCNTLNACSHSGLQCCCNLFVKVNISIFVTFQSQIGTPNHDII